MTDRYGWRSFWWLNVVLYGVMVLLQLFLHPETHYDRRHLVGADDRASMPSDLLGAEKLTVAAPDEPTRAPGRIDRYLGEGAPVRAQFATPRRRASKGEFWLSLWIPIKLFSFPIVEWSSFAFSWSASCFLMLNLTQSQAFAAPPYSMSSTAVGN